MHNNSFIAIVMLSCPTCTKNLEWYLSTGFRSTPAAHSDLSSRIYPSYDYMDNDFSAEAFKRNYNAKEFIKKSLADQKSLRFHQCYFNPISCFRRWAFTEGSSMYYVITFLGHFQPPPFFSVPLNSYKWLSNTWMLLNKKDSIIAKVFTKNLTHIADPVLYQYC